MPVLLSRFEWKDAYETAHRRYRLLASRSPRLLRHTSPTIDYLAQNSVKFDRCYASDAPCLPSRTALATCRHGVTTGVVTHYDDGQWYEHPGSGHDPDPDRPLSFRHLAEHGVHTASISSFSQRYLTYHFSGAFQ
jgi:arylsulfatase A-like enzyme